VATVSLSKKTGIFERRKLRYNLYYILAVIMYYRKRTESEDEAVYFGLTGFATTGFIGRPVNPPCSALLCRVRT